MLHLFLAPGFEEIEALTTLDILKRCGVEVMVVAMTGKRLIAGAHGISVMADSLFRRSIVAESQGFILPGGMPGAENLMHHDGLRKALIAHNGDNKLISAICAAPMVIGELGILSGKRATCYPGFEKHLKNATHTGNMVEEDGNIITGKGPAAAVPFAFAIASRFVDRETARRVRYDMLFEEPKGMDSIIS